MPAWSASFNVCTIKHYALTILHPNQATWHARLTGLWCALQVAGPATPWAARATARTMTATQSTGMVHMCVPNTLIHTHRLQLEIARLHYLVLLPDMAQSACRGCLLHLRIVAELRTVSVQSACHA